MEGIHLVEEALAADLHVEMLVKSEDAPWLPFDIGAQRVVEVKASIFEALSDTESPQGWLAVCLMSQQPKMGSGNVLLIDGIRDPGNMGTIIRTAEAVGMSGIYVSPDTVDVYNGKVIRATQGALFHIPIVAYDLEDAIRSLIEEGKVIYGTSMHAEASYMKAAPRESYALLLGNEAEGISPPLLRMVDKTVSIPIVGNAESLNVAVAAGVLMYGWLNHD
ncbi:TrmH family RNA methyltransferase [Geomicrobium halophilum]|uniref:TrmH family RNA methyltransferase n=1 Tax=Geomicrobium halophilum TaxID=549000 RepID=A0A841PHL3_9BACL|nr:TrmH family RNA methyltransferase [Geomicrobium halophilum]